MLLSAARTTQRVNDEPVKKFEFVFFLSISFGNEHQLSKN